MPALSVMLKPVSGLCNMHCDYCFYCDETEKRTKKSFGIMSEDTLKNVIRRTLPHAEGMIFYAFQGGEPLLRGLDFFRRAVALEKQYNQNRIAVYNALQTNGYEISREWCEFFRENHFLVGLSVDGTKKIHDSLRRERGTGKPTFDRVLKSAELMEEYGVNYNILTVVTREIAGNIEEVYAGYRERGWHYQQYIACLDPLGEAHGKAFYSLTPKDYGECLKKLFSLWLKDLKKGKQPYIRQFENWVMLAAGYRAESCDQCGICSIQQVVEADGSVYPCDFYALDDYYLGNFNRDRLETIDRRREKIGFIERSRRLSDACRQCRYYRLCRGGCQRNRDYNPAAGSYENRLCRGYKLFFEQYYDVLMQLGECFPAPLPFYTGAASSRSFL